MVTWHGDLVAWLDDLRWLRTLNDWLTAVLGPFRERHQDNLVLELTHGGRWVGHPLHSALSDLPIGLWTGATVDCWTRVGGTAAASSPPAPPP